MSQYNEEYKRLEEILSSIINVHGISMMSKDIDHYRKMYFKLLPDYVVSLLQNLDSYSKLHTEVYVYLLYIMKATQYPDVSLDATYNFIDDKIYKIYTTYFDKYGRSEILGRCFNTITRKEEFILSNSRWVNTDGSNITLINIMNDDILPLEYIKVIDKTIYRDKKLKNILNES